MTRLKALAPNRLPIVLALALTASWMPSTPFADEPIAPAVLEQLEERLVVASERALRSTVGLHIEERRSVGDGSGVIVTEDGYVLTVAHMFAQPGVRIRVTLGDGRRVWGTGLGREGQADFALIKLDGDGPWPSAPMGDSKALERNELCLMTGHAGGLVQGRPAVVRVGTFEGRRGRWLRTDCAMMPGDSGGALFDLDGNVLGINSFIEERIDNNFHVPVELYRENWDRLVAQESWNPARGETPRRLAGSLGLYVAPSPDGLIVRALMPGYDAGSAGVQEGDLVTAIDGLPITSTGELRRKEGDAAIGTVFRLTVERGEETLELDLTISLRKRE